MRNSYWLRSGLYTLSEKATSLLFGFGGAVLLFRVLPQDQFGFWVLFLSITSILEVGRIGLLQNALVKFLTTSTKEEAGKITTASVALNVILTFSIVAILLALSNMIGAWLEAPVLGLLLKVYCLTTLALIPFFQCNYIQQANLDFKGIFWGNLAKGGVLFGYIAVVFFANYPVRLMDLAICQIVAAVSASLVALVFTKKYLVVSKKIDWGWVHKLFRYGKFVFGTNLSTQLYKNVDKLLLGGLPAGGAMAVALYDAAIRVTNLTDVPTASMANILFPQSAKRVTEGNGAIKMLYEKAVGATLGFMAPCILLVMVFADWIVVLVAGPGYAEAGDLLRITIWFGLFLPYAVQFGTVLDSIGKPEVNFKFTVASLFIIVVVNVISISKFGVVGAASGTLLAYLLAFCMMQFYLHRTLGVNPLHPLKYMVYFYGKLLKYGWKKLALGTDYSTSKDLTEKLR